jgi:spore germination protein YaaH
MSRQRFRYFVAASICGLVPLIPAAPVHASSLLSSPSTALTAAKPESAVLRKFRDSPTPVMERAAQFEATAAPRAFDRAAAQKKQAVTAVANPRLYREVFGFAFASSLGDPTIGYPSWNFTLLSTVAYFGIHVDWTGDFSGGSALDTWNNPSGPVPGFIQTAHASGTKVVLTIAMFDSTSGTPNMCSALQRSNVTIQRTVAEIQAKGIDGVNVDYESNNTTCTEPGTGIVASSQSLFTNFVAHLRAALPAGSYLSIDTYSGAAGYRDPTSGAYLGFFDIGGLNNYADSFFVMAYDMEYANWDQPPLNCPSFCIGPTSPLSTYAFNQSKASSEYRAVVPASKVIMGIPYYGRKECVAVMDPTLIPANALGTSVAADGYLDASTENGYTGNTLYTSHRETRDPLSATKWDTFSSTTAGCNRELYWDDAVALGNKYNLVINDHLRGAGIFALNYGGGAPELWNLINLKFGQCSEAAITADHTSPQIPATSVTFTGTALCAGTGTFRFWMQPPGGVFSMIQDFSTTNTVTWDTTGKALGTYTFQVDAKNQGATPAAGFDTQSRLAFRLALCVTPTITSDVASPRMPGTAVTFTSTVACQGTPEYRYWVQPPGGAWTIAQDYSPAATFKWDTSHLAYGDYNIGIHVRTTGTTVPYESVQSVLYSLRSCISTALTTDKASPQPTGTQVVLSGAATCDGANQYRFMIQSPASTWSVGSWSVVQDFASTATFTWVGSGAGGTYNLEVDAKSALAPASSMVSARLAYTLASCSAVTLASSPATPQQPGPTVTLTGTASCTGTPQYRFWIHKPDGSVSVVQDYGPTNTYAWNTTGLALGVYGLRVDARNLGATTTTYEAVAVDHYTLADPSCATPTVTIDPASPQGMGTTLSFTASTTICPHPLYEFWLMVPGTTTWLLGQAYSTSPVWHWNTRGAPPGDYQLGAWVRDAFSGSTTGNDLGKYDAYVPFTSTLTATPCPAPTVTASPASPTTSGTPVAITASAACSHANPQYEFWARWQGSSSWQLLQPYSPSATYNWNSKGAAPGIEYFGVWVRDASSVGTHSSAMGSYDALASIAYSVTTPSCASLTATAAPTSVAHGSGTHVIITGAATGCSNPNPLYEFWMRPAWLGTWQLVQGYSPSATYDWNTTGAPAGTIYFGVWAKDVNSPTGSFDANASTPVTAT